MARFTYKDWKGRKAMVLRDMQNRAHTIRFKKGEIVLVGGYDEWLKFRIQKGKRSLWKVEATDIVLLEHPVRTLQDKIFDYLIRNTWTPDRWHTASEIARGINENKSLVASQLTAMTKKFRIGRMPGMGKRGGPGYRPAVESLRSHTRYDWLMAGPDPFA